MDESFFLRAKRLLEQREAEPIDYAELVDLLCARQDVSPTASAASRSAAAAPQEEDPQAICTLIRGEEGWRHAVQIQRGCFNRAAAARPVKTP